LPVKPDQTTANDRYLTEQHIMSSGDRFAPVAASQPPSSDSPSKPALGPLIRLYNRAPSELPSHSALPPGNDAATISAYAAEVLTEAEAFMTSYIPANFKTKNKDKSSPPATAPVELLSHEIDAKSIPGAGVVAETWFARTSIHENASKTGTATWAEADAGLRKDHSVHEMEYTPDVKDAHLVLNWSEELAQVNGEVGGWKDVQAEVREMVHHIPPPLNNRVFTVMVVTALRKDERQFLVVQMPVEGKGLPGTKYFQQPKITPGQYVSIERGELVSEGEWKWQMGTASDAGGNLPMWAQKMGVPGAVVKDVGLFMDWTAKRRGGNA